MSHSLPITYPRFRQILLNWYQCYGRKLPWRTTKDPYKIWLSEVILQQTRVAQGVSYYHHFITRYPTLKDLADAPEEAILRDWQGLGYYGRARNLHICAKTLLDEYGGVFPTDYQTLLKLKGIGPYTAAAIASICFKEVVAAIDGNVYRVLARFFGLYEDMSTTKGREAIGLVAHGLVDPHSPDEYTQAIMDFGALQCTPRSPSCFSCPLQSHCIAFATKAQSCLPIKSKKVAKKNRYFHYFLMQNKGLWYMRKRDKGDIWAKMYDFYLIESTHSASLQELENPLIDLIHQYRLPIAFDHQEVSHTLTHQQLSVKFYTITLSKPFMDEVAHILPSYGLHGFTLKQLQRLPKPVLIDAFLSRSGLKLDK